MRVAELVSANLEFQSSINIDFDFGSPDRVRSLIPTDSVCRYVEEILKDVVAPSSQRAKSLVGPYGTGKSHITLAALSAMWIKDDEIYARLIKGYKEKGFPFGKTFEQFSKEGQRLLPVVISGSSSDLQHSLLYALRNALRMAGLLDLMPRTNFNGALEVIERWRVRYPETLERFEDLSGAPSETFESRLRGLETAAYEEFVGLYPQLTSGGSFDALDGVSVIDVYEQVLSELEEVGISGIYVVYDEFSKFLESNIESASVEDTKLLQDFAERCNRSSQNRQLHMLLISHKSLSNYIDAKLPKDKVDGWRGVSGRFREIEMRNDANQSYELISNAIVKEPSLWRRWLLEDDGANAVFLKKIRSRYKNQGLLDETNEDVVIFGCFPLHPTTAFLLPELSERVAQNERTLFTFLCSAEENALPRLLEDAQCFIAPDAVFDYFEPLLKKEYYASPVHKAYELAKTSMKRVGSDTLEGKIVKSIALATIVSRYELVAPTRQFVLDVYCDCGYSELEVNAALQSLVEDESVIYLRQSNSLLKLKESSGVRIDAEIEDRSGLLKTQLSPSEILNSCKLVSALYPSKHNEEHSIIRYFDCGFVSFSELASGFDGRRLVSGKGDGFVAAVVPDGPDDMERIDALASSYTASVPMSVIVAPRGYKDISKTLYRFAAASALKEEAAEDEVLSEEYEIALEDYSEIVGAFIDGYFRPEIGASRYYASGHRKNKISRRRRLSDLLSNLCDDAFPDTPRITSESLNKNDLTGTASHSRAKILAGLCATNLEPNLGFIGNGQETAMMRSALRATGVIADFEYPQVELKPTDPKMRRVFETIESFVETSWESSFQDLYDDLTGIREGIGMKRGPIPLYLAIVLREHRDEIVITRDGEEKPFTPDLLNDIAVTPGKFRLSLIDWTPSMGRFVAGLGDLFSCETGASRAAVIDAIRLWYVSLPQVTRNAHENHSSVLVSSEAWLAHTKFFKAIKRADADSNKFLFEELPAIFDGSVEDEGLIRAIEKEKAFCDGYLESSISNLANQLKRLFSPSAQQESSLDSVLKDWAESLPSVAKTHVLSGLNNQIFSAIKGSIPDERTTVSRIAKAATSLRIDDWNDARFKEFLGLVGAAKNEAEAASSAAGSEGQSGRLAISFLDGSGNEQVRTFDSVECSGRARLLKNSITSCLEDMGRSLTPEEKRQVVFEILKEMC